MLARPTCATACCASGRAMPRSTSQVVVWIDPSSSILKAGMAIPEKMCILLDGSTSSTSM